MTQTSEWWGKSYLGSTCPDACCTGILVQVEEELMCIGCRVHFGSVEVMRRYLDSQLNFHIYEAAKSIDKRMQACFRKEPDDDLYEDLLP